MSSSYGRVPLHVGFPLSLSQWLAHIGRYNESGMSPSWSSQNESVYECRLPRPKAARELGPARMARRYGGSNLQGQVGHQRAFRPRRASHGSPCRWLGRRDVVFVSRGSGQAASHRREVGGVDSWREVYSGIRTSLDVTRSWTHVGTTVGTHVRR